MRVANRDHFRSSWPPRKAPRCMPRLVGNRRAAQCTIVLLQGRILAVGLPLLLVLPGWLFPATANSLPPSSTHGPLRLAGRDLGCHGCRSARRGAYLFNPEGNRVLRKVRARSGFIELQGKVFVLAETRDCSRGWRLKENQKWDHILFFLLLEGGTGLRAHNGTLYAYSKDASNPFAGLISDSILGRTKTFLLHLEELSRTLLRRRLTKDGTPWTPYCSCVSTRCTSPRADFVTSLSERCVHGIFSRRRSAPQVFVERLPSGHGPRRRDVIVPPASRRGRGRHQCARGSFRC